jgi:hypothetical protein
MGDLVKGVVLAVVIIASLCVVAAAPGLDEGSTGLSTDVVLAVVGGALSVALEVVPGRDERSSWRSRRMVTSPGRVMVKQFGAADRDT